MTESVERLELVSESERRTDEYARVCAAAVSESLIVGLRGPLGAGKTRFVRAFCGGLGVDPADVTSPTFVLMQLYEGTRWSVSHFDAYRLGDPEEFEALGAAEYLDDPGRVCLVEWADRVADILPPDRVTADIELSGPNVRRIRLSAAGDHSGSFLRRVRQLLEVSGGRDGKDRR